MVLLILGIVARPGWIAWLVIAPIGGLLLGRPIPQLVDPTAPFDPLRFKIGWGLIAIFALTFTPWPFYFGGE